MAATTQEHYTRADSCTEVLCAVLSLHVRCCENLQVQLNTGFQLHPLSLIGRHSTTTQQSNSVHCTALILNTHIKPSKSRNLNTALLCTESNTELRTGIALQAPTQEQREKHSSGTLSAVLHYHRKSTDSKTFSLSVKCMRKKKHLL